MEALVDRYLNHVQEENDIVIEGDGWVLVGYGAFMITLLGLAIWGSIWEAKKIPNHPHWHKLYNQYVKMFRQCAKYFPDDYTKIKAGGEMGDVSANFDYEEYKANPKRIKCQMTARLDYLKKFIKWISKTKAEEICKYNDEKHKPRCYGYVMQVKETSIDELRDLTRVLSASSERKMLSKGQFFVISRVLNPKIKKK